MAGVMPQFLLSSAKLLLKVYQGQEMMSSCGQSQLVVHWAPCNHWSC